jgi:hypothetical protein
MSKPLSRNNFVPLSEAAWKFAPRRLKEMYWNLRELPAPKLPDPSSAREAEGLQAISAQFAHMSRTGPAIREMQKDIMEKLRRGDLEARGIRTRPDMGEALEPIPRYYFDHAKINWERNVLENFGRRYAAVEVCRAEASEEAIDGEPSPQEETPQAVVPQPSAAKKKGRPSKPIMALLAELDHEGSVDLRTCKRIRVCEMVKERARKAGHDLRTGFSESAIISHLYRYLSQTSPR